MTNRYLTEDGFTDLMPDRQSGKTRLQIQKQLARQFFTRVDNKSAADATGKSIVLKKGFIRLGIVTSPVFFLLFMLSYFQEFGIWYAAVIIPIVGICRTVIYGLTGHQGGWLIGSIPLLASLGLLFFKIEGSEPLFQR